MYNMDDHWGCYADSNKPVHKDTNTLWFHLHEISSVVKVMETDILSQEYHRFGGLTCQFPGIIFLICHFRWGKVRTNI